MFRHFRCGHEDELEVVMVRVLIMHAMILSTFAACGFGGNDAFDAEC